MLTLPAVADGGPEASPLADSNEAIAEFETCMERQRFDLAGDVVVHVDGEGANVNGKNVDREAFVEAEHECGPPFPLPADDAGIILPAPGNELDCVLKDD